MPRLVNQATARASTPAQVSAYSSGRFGVGQARVVVQGGVQVGVSGAVAAVLGPACWATEDPVAAALGDAAELLDVDVNHSPGPGAFIAAHGRPGGPAQRGQGGLVVPEEDAVDGGGRDAIGASRTGPIRCPRRRRTTSASMVSGVRWGRWCERLERSHILASSCRR